MFTLLGTESLNQHETVSALFAGIQLRPPLVSVISTRELPANNAASADPFRRISTVATMSCSVFGRKRECMASSVTAEDRGIWVADSKQMFVE